MYPKVVHFRQKNSYSHLPLTTLIGWPLQSGHAGVIVVH
jgi:hypothetical protein